MGGRSCTQKPGCLRAGPQAQAVVSPVGCGVELGHEFAVGGAGGGEFAVAFF